MSFQAQRLSTEQLKLAYRRHVADNGTNTMNEECRRLYLIQEIGAELRRRGEQAD